MLTCMLTKSFYLFIYLFINIKFRFQNRECVVEVHAHASSPAVLIICRGVLILSLSQLCLCKVHSATQNILVTNTNVLLERCYQREVSGISPHRHSEIAATALLGWPAVAAVFSCS